jgi:pyridoxine 4-dehydrogenase
MIDKTNVPQSTVKLGEPDDRLEISRLGFGTIHLTTQRGFNTARPNAIELLQTAHDRGVNFFDTADSYGPGVAEDTIREALYPYRGLTIATKGGYEHPTLKDWLPNGTPSHLRNAVDGSLKRLGLDQIDLYFLHVRDQTVPYEDSLETLKELQVQGKIRYLGVSRVSLELLKQARDILGDRLIAVENCYNVFYPQGYPRMLIDPQTVEEPDSEAVLSYCEAEGIAFVTYEPLLSGFAMDLAIQIPFIMDKYVLVQTMAQKYGVTVERLMLAALLQRSPNIIVIPGTSNLDHLRDNVLARELVLDTADLGQIWS